ncbi:hypothetical protein SRHO_G00210870 [Serrasalmus rhombeus]
MWVWDGVMVGFLVLEDGAASLAAERVGPPSQSAGVCVELQSPSVSECQLKDASSAWLDSLVAIATNVNSC